MVRTSLLVLVALVAAALPARAQTGAAPAGCSFKWEVTSQDALSLNAGEHYRLVKNVQIDCNDVQLFADEAEVFPDADRMRAVGNVVFVTGTNRISAERMEFNTKTKTGTFFVASGIANLENRGIDRSLFGTQEPDMYFWGDTIEKLGPKTYRITHGGFTTCVQPTPRWEMVANSVTLTLEKRAVLTNMILKVKDVPVFYMPAMYYPINKEDRATGFLIPIYGTSTVKGQTINNAFFWAINRSQDATLYHSFYSKTGQAIGGEYRYLQGAGSSGNIQANTVREHEAVYRQPDGTDKTFPGIDNYQIDGTVLQALPAHLRLSGSAHYFSSLVAQQRYQQNIYAATTRTRTFGTSLQGNWGANTLSTTVERNEYFNNDTDSNVVGSLPRINYSRAEKPIGTLPIYFGSSTEFVTLIRTDKTTTTTNERGLTRIDVLPSLRFPFTKLPYLTFNSSLRFRETYWTESLVNNVQAPEGITRHYVTMASTITGPVLTRIWNTPGRTYAQKFKHVIEPVFTFSRTTSIDNRASIVQLDGTDSLFGGDTTITYGLNNRLYAKKDSSREILTVGISQTYHSVVNASTVDPNSQSSYTPGLRPTHLLPVAIQAHVSPTTSTDVTFSTEYNTQVHAIQRLAANGGIAHGWVVANVGWSLTRYIPDLPGFNVLASATHYLNSTAVVRKPGNAFSTSYAFNYDMRNKDFLNQRIIAHYNSQCCGIAVEYQKFNFGTNAGRIGVPRDHRFNLSFTLAGIGTFSDLFGAFGGQQQGR